MKRIYLCENEKNIRNVYCDTKHVYTKSEVLNSLESFKNTEYVFSTWGMPTFTEEEIKKYTVRNLKVEIDYGVGRMSEIKENYFIQVVRVYENDEIISISAYAWENEIPYPSAYSNKLK